jgi:hypothetical protein
MSTTSKNKTPRKRHLATLVVGGIILSLILGTVSRAVSSVWQWLLDLVARFLGFAGMPQEPALPTMGSVLAFLLIMATPLFVGLIWLRRDRRRAIEARQSFADAVSAFVGPQWIVSRILISECGTFARLVIQRHTAMADQPGIVIPAPSAELCDLMALLAHRDGTGISCLQPLGDEAMDVKIQCVESTGLDSEELESMAVDAGNQIGGAMGVAIGATVVGTRTALNATEERATPEDLVQWCHTELFAMINDPGKSSFALPERFLIDSFLISHAAPHLPAMPGPLPRITYVVRVVDAHDADRCNAQFREILQSVHFTKGRIEADLLHRS